MQSSYEVRRAGGAETARSGRLLTPHGIVETPALVPLATSGSVQSLTPDDLLALDVRIVAVDGFELACRPGIERIAALGGLRAMLSWPGPLLALSGSDRFLGENLPEEEAIAEYAARVAVADGVRVSDCRAGRPGSASDAGLRLASPLDGAMRLLRPEDVVRSAGALGVDLALALDQPSAVDGPAPVGRAAERIDARAASWARRGAEEKPHGLALVGLARGAEEAGGVVVAGQIASQELAGVALRFGPRRPPVCDWDGFPASAIRVLVGGVTSDEIAAAAVVADLIVTAAPTALAERGVLYTGKGPVDARDPSSERDGRPIELDCGCPTCRQHSRAYIRHLFVAGELLAYRLAAVHNLHFLTSRIAPLRVGC